MSSRGKGTGKGILGKKGKDNLQKRSIIEKPGKDTLCYRKMRKAIRNFKENIKSYTRKLDSIGNKR